MSAKEVTQERRMLKLKHVATLVGARAESRPEGSPYVGLENIQSRTGKLLSVQGLEGDEFADGTSTVNLFEPGDVLFGKLRPYLAKAWVATFAGACTTEALVLRPKDCIRSDYLCRSLLAPDFIREVDTATFGSKMPRADWADIGNIEIYVPPLGEQAEIERDLATQAGHISALIDAKQSLMDLLAEKRCSLIANAVTRGLNPGARMRESGIDWLGEVPAHWGESRIAWMFTERDERGRPDLPLLEVSIHGGVRVREFSSERIEQTAADPNTYKVALQGDICFNKMRMWQGAVGTVPQDGLVSPDYVVAEPVRQLNSSYYGRVLQTPQFSAEAGRRSHGIVWDRLRLYWEEFRDMVVPIPPLAEQDLIVAAINNAEAQIEALSSATKASMTLLEERRAALIAHLVSKAKNAD